MNLKVKYVVTNMFGLYSYLYFLECAYAEDVAERRASTRRQNIELRQSLMSISEVEFRQRYMLSKELFKELVKELRPHLPSQLRSDGINVETKILIALSFYATGSYQAPVGDNEYHSVSQTSVSKAIREVTAALNKPEVYKRHLVSPINRIDRENIKGRFYEKKRLPGVLGCIDTTHVAITTPNTREEHFINRNGYHSLNVLIMCNVDSMIMSVDPSYPGSAHDSKVWENSELKHFIDRLYGEDEDVYILGDAGYRLSSTLMTPILKTEPGTPEAYYTALHKSARSVVASCIETLKARFRCLLAEKKLYYAPTTAARIINACCVLHNMAQAAGIEFEPLTAEELHRERGLTQRASFRRPLVDQTPTTAAARAALGRTLGAGRKRRNELVRRVWRERNSDLSATK